MRIMKSLKENLFDEYEMYAEGKNNCRAAEQISLAMNKLIIVDEIISTPNKGMIIKFSRSRDFNTKLEKAK